MMAARVGMGAKAPWPILVTLAGMITLVIWVPAKALAPMLVSAVLVVILSPVSTISPDSLLFSKALCPIEVNVLGKVKLVSPVL